MKRLPTITGIDLWFLARLKHIVDSELALQADQDLSPSRLLALKQIGISDKRIGELVGKTGLEIRAIRKQLEYYTRLSSRSTRWPPNFHPTPIIST